AADHRSRARAQASTSWWRDRSSQIGEDLLRAAMSHPAWRHLPAMKIRNLLNPSRPCFSFEFYPPKTPEGTRSLFATLGELAPLEPGFVSVTQGAGGTDQQDTVALVSRIRGESGIEAMAHLTCAGHTREALRGELDRLAGAGI